MTSEAPRLGHAHPPADRPEPAAYPTEPSEPVQRPSCHPGRSAQRGVERSRAASASALFDLHCHLDFDPDTRAAAQVLAEDVPEFLDAYADRVDYVVDAIDTISAKLAVAQYADAHGVRLVSSMGAANKLRPEAFRFADVFDTVNCPLCRIMRKEARKRGIRRLRVLYSCEQPVPVPVREGAERRERSNLGTASFVPPIMGQMIAGEVLCALAGVGAHAGEEHA